MARECFYRSQSFYGRSRRRLLVFDYDGTLVAHHALAQLSAPPPVLLQVLEALCEVMRCTCYKLPPILKVGNEFFLCCTDISLRNRITWYLTYYKDMNEGLFSAH